MTKNKTKINRNSSCDKTPCTLEDKKIRSRDESIVYYVLYCKICGKKFG